MIQLSSTKYFHQGSNILNACRVIWTLNKRDLRECISLKGVKNNSPSLARKYAQLFVVGHYLFRSCMGERTSAEKYPWMFLRHMEVVFQLRCKDNLKIR